MNGENILTIDQLVADFPAFGEKTVRWWIYNGRANGFEACLIRIGSRIYIDRERFIAWVEHHRPVGELIDLISGIAMHESQAEARDVLGRVYEYFLGQFAGAEGKRGGEFYTPRSVVRVLVEMLEPFPDPKRSVEGRVYDPCCGSGGMFVQAERLRRICRSDWRGERGFMGRSPRRQCLRHL